MFQHTLSTHGQLKINSQNLFTPATKIMSLQAMWTRAIRGADVVLPAAAGQKSRRRRFDALVIPLEMLVTGRGTLSGAAADANPYKQLDLTMAALDTGVVAPPSSQTGHAIKWTARDGTEYDSTGFVTAWIVTPHPNNAPMNTVQFDLTIPSGVWT